MRSMTGFGEAEAAGACGRCRVQIFSVNGRYAKLAVNMPQELASIEILARRCIQKMVGRGQVTASISFTPPGGDLEDVVVDRRACEKLVSQFKKISSKLGLANKLDLTTLVDTGAVVRKVPVSISIKSVWALVRKAVAKACADLARSQEREGRAHARDLSARWKRVGRFVEAIEERKGVSLKNYEGRIREKVRSILKDADYDEGRLLSEVCIFADRVDITEELVRAKSHLSHFRTLLRTRGETGRKLDFTLQEILREVNTAANKALDARISSLAIGIKAEIEKIREQLQNVQ